VLVTQVDIGKKTISASKYSGSEYFLLLLSSIELEFFDTGKKQLMMQQNTQDLNIFCCCYHQSS
jgi:hypothetical protein